MTNFLVTIINLVIEFCGNVIPAYDFESETYNRISDSISAVVSFLTDVNFIIPLADIVTIALLVFGLRLFKFALFAGNWIVRRICDLLP